jgi:3-hydroxybutyryl-CoA dehydrogenase
MPTLSSAGEVQDEPARDAAAIIGVLGAGTMGAGIAQVALRSGAQTLLFDPFPAALERGIERVRDGLAREVSKGRLSEQEGQDALGRITPAADLQQLAQCELIIEAVPESLQLKHELFAALSEIVSPQCVLASNTSSLLVTAIAAAAKNPERVVGMHFFNPAPVMRLLEVVAGVESGDAALALADATGEAMGKTVIRATDGPGFLVNRCNRPFGLEALRLLQERIADLESIDRICRMGGAFRMGPFELMDLVGVDVGFEISKSFFEQSFGEPRWRPSPIAARYVAAGLNGRKSGRGYYDYSDGSGPPYRAADPERPDPSLTPAEGVIVISGSGALAEQLRGAARDAGYEVRAPHEPTGGVLPSLAIDCSIDDADGNGGASADTPGHDGGARLILCARGSLSTLDTSTSAVGFHALAPLEKASMVELTRGAEASAVAAGRAERFFNALGKHVEWVADAPGLVLGRIVCQLINEAAFALGEGVGSASDIDLGMVLGLSHPRGPLEWADEMGIDHVLAVLDGLSDEYREDRYRAAPALRRLAAAGRLGTRAGAGFFEHRS